MSTERTLSCTDVGKQASKRSFLCRKGPLLTTIRFCGGTGTYARTRAIDRLVDEFLAAKPEVRKQIVSLGAGSDTRFFRLMGSGKEPVPDVLYHELDFPSNTAQKLWVIGKSAVLKQLLGNEDQIVWAADELHAPNYHLHPVDLRTLHPTDGSSAGPRSLPHIDAGLPTLLLSECCLTYLKPDAADAVVKYFGQTILKPETPLGLALYEPVNPFDAFGKVMISNLATRGIVLQTVNKYSSLGAQKARLKTYELDDGQRAVDANFLHQRWIDEAEKERINELEMLDEVEELQMLMSHYCVAWGWRNGSDPGVWEKWREIEDQPSDT